MSDHGGNDDGDDGNVRSRSPDRGSRPETADEKLERLTRQMSSSARGSRRPSASSGSGNSTPRASIHLTSNLESRHSRGNSRRSRRSFDGYMDADSNSAGSKRVASSMAGTSPEPRPNEGRRLDQMQDTLQSIVDRQSEFEKVVKRLRESDTCALPSSGSSANIATPHHDHAKYVDDMSASSTTLAHHIGQLQEQLRRKRSARHEERVG